jgi:TolB protein
MRRSRCSAIIGVAATLCGKVAVVVTAAAVPVSVAPAHATPPGENGRVAYRMFLNQEQTRAAILTIKPDGSGKRWVTHPGRRVVHLVPDWSPDGRWIAFVRAKGKGPDSSNPSDRPRIFRIHPNGGGRRDLSTSCTEPCLWHDDPTWSPNGRWIAFSAYLGEPRHLGNLEIDLMVMRADGTHVRHLTRHPDKAHADFAPQWAPNGKRLVFARYSGRRDRTAIFTIRPDGSGVRRLTPWRIDAHGEPDWSPNRRWINYESYRGPCLVHPNGEGRHCLVSDGDQFEWGSGSFSPDGTMIVVPRAPGVGPPSHFDVFRMNIDGSGLFNVTQTNRWDGTPDWGPRRK